MFIKKVSRIVRTIPRVVVLLAVTLVIACSQWLYYSIPPQLGEDQGSADQPLNPHYHSLYFKSDNGFQVIAEQEGKHTSLEGDIHTILDYTEKEYYLNDEYPDFTDKERLDAELNRQSTFKEFVSELLENILSSKPTVGPINNVRHYNESNIYKKTGGHKIPTMSGKLRENNGAEPIRITSDDSGSSS
ncbi:uncharacterized protein CYBJADRAFT_175564 [Cyberlindnera jadinii NRRL Y-1542]|uniref:Uncharacterized protein n=1 Tax=Cyberlindnera jadinii (strain ATCC 18201 / CBS 1600 / BCRC 20928 / JCM 3617 / NBRC 0987 / NRRL Y-1542) TaxID=983966 RepID=A0A1E4RUI4_CYBJN|nr:hypothetical protein CYBJADRAFT_175564 [Cyberlindnera jadinii NRRL Y-1542]ODV70939.1 hypothetical protein CYBJADRAFT_175564 [Cyberlindnera jadinii NRRL Y-1542]